METPNHNNNLLTLKIDNLNPTINNGYRGCSHSSKRNQWALPKFFEAGITTIIDLRTADHTDRFSQQCQELGFEYFHFTVDSKNTPTEDIIAFLPELIRVIDRGYFYIACAMGLHRTDIALSLYYLFNQNPTTPIPCLIGHKQENGELKYEDIFRRANAIFKALERDELREQFTRKKKALIDFNAPQ